MSGAPVHIWKTITAAQAEGRCLVMGIVNTTPDSFSDGGAYLAPDAAVEHALHLALEGADIIDIGGESTRPGSGEVPEEEELRRVIPVIEGIRKRSAVPLSIDTRKAAVARAACAAGADIINDISALQHDPAMAETVRECSVPVVLMHMQGTPETMQHAPSYEDVFGDVYGFFRERIAACRSMGIQHIIADPGIGFGKRLEHNVELIRRLGEFNALEVPILLGTSRKRFIGELTGLSEPGERIGGSIASALAGAMYGAAIVRVHDVRDTVAALNVFRAVTTTGEIADAL